MSAGKVDKPPRIKGLVKRCRSFKEDLISRLARNRSLGKEDSHHHSGSEGTSPSKTLNSHPPQLALSIRLKEAYLTLQFVESLIRKDCIDLLGGSSNVMLDLIGSLLSDVRKTSESDSPTYQSVVSQIKLVLSDFLSAVDFLLLKEEPQREICYEKIMETLRNIREALDRLKWIASSKENGHGSNSSTSLLLLSNSPQSGVSSPTRALKSPCSSSASRLDDSHLEIKKPPLPPKLKQWVTRSFDTPPSPSSSPSPFIHPTPPSPTQIHVAHWLSDSQSGARGGGELTSRSQSGGEDFSTKSQSGGRDFGPNSQSGGRGGGDFTSSIQSGGGDFGPKSQSGGGGGGDFGPKSQSGGERGGDLTSRSQSGGGDLVPKSQWEESSVYVCKSSSSSGGGGGGGGRKMRTYSDSYYGSNLGGSEESLGESNGEETNTSRSHCSVSLSLGSSLDNLLLVDGSGSGGGREISPSRLSTSSPYSPPHSKSPAGGHYDTDDVFVGDESVDDCKDEECVPPELPKKKRQFELGGGRCGSPYENVDEGEMSTWHGEMRAFSSRLSYSQTKQFMSYSESRATLVGGTNFEAGEERPPLPPKKKHSITAYVEFLHNFDSSSHHLNYTSSSHHYSQSHHHHMLSRNHTLGHTPTHSRPHFPSLFSPAAPLNSQEDLLENYDLSPSHIYHPLPKNMPKNNENYIINNLKTNGGNVTTGGSVTSGGNFISGGSITSGGNVTSGGYANSGGSVTKKSDESYFAPSGENYNHNGLKMNSTPERNVVIKSIDGDSSSSRNYENFSINNNVSDLPPALPPKASKVRESVSEGRICEAGKGSGEKSPVVSLEKCTGTINPSSPPHLGESVESPQLSIDEDNPDLYLLDVSGRVILTESLGASSSGSKVPDGPEVKGADPHILMVYAANPDLKDLKFREVFLLTYRTFLRPLDLVTLLWKRCEYFEKKTDRISIIHKRASVELFVDVICSLTPMDMEEEMISKLLTCIYHLVNSGEIHSALKSRKGLLDKFDVRRKLLGPKPIPATLAVSTETPSLLRWSATSIAQQMTLLDSDLFRQLEPAELLLWAREQQEDFCPALNNFTDHFNKVSYWARSKVLLCHTSRERNRTMKKLIEVMRKLRDYSNFNSLLAVLAALDSAPLRRLGFSRRLTEALKPHALLTDSSGSFRTYRLALADSKPPCIPYIGLVLQDLTFVHIGNADFLTDGKVNWLKRWQQWLVLEPIRRFHACHYGFMRNDSLLSFLNNFDESLNDDDLWQLSESIKPRGKS